MPVTPWGDRGCRGRGAGGRFSGRCGAPLRALLAARRPGATGRGGKGKIPAVCAEKRRFLSREMPVSKLRNAACSAAARCSPPPALLQPPPAPQPALLALRSEKTGWELAFTGRHSPQSHSPRPLLPKNGRPRLGAALRGCRRPAAAARWASPEPGAPGAPRCRPAPGAGLVPRVHPRDAVIQEPGGLGGSPGEALGVCAARRGALDGGRLRARRGIRVPEGLRALRPARGGRGEGAYWRPGPDLPRGFFWCRDGT